MKRNIASALNNFVEMDKVDQQEYLDELTDYVCTRGAARLQTEDAIRQSMTPAISRNYIRNSADLRPERSLVAAA